MTDRCEIPLTNATSDQIRDILKSARRIAVVGHSDDPARDSYRIGRYLAGQGYEVFPVNPKARSTTMIAGVDCVALRATSVMRLMMRPGAVSMSSEASPATGRKPRAVVPMNAASWGWRLSRKM